MGAVKRPQYGIDAPGLVRGFLVAGLAFGTAGFSLTRWAGGRPWPGWIASLLLLVSLYALGMCGYMLWGSLIAKVQGRDAMLNLLTWTGAEQVLDVGCGRGLLLVGAARRLTSGHATGIDLWLAKDQTSNTQSAPLENATIEGVAERVSVITGDMRDLPFPDHAFDVVLSNWAIHNLEQMQDRRRALAEIVRVLRQGGAILLTDIANRDEYATELRRLGMTDVRVVIQSPLRDTVNNLVSFGSFRPATILATRARPD